MQSQMATASARAYGCLCIRPRHTSSLSNLFNTVSTSSTVRYDTYVAIIKVASKNGEVEAVIPQLHLVDAWLAEWGVSLNQTRALYLLISEKLSDSHPQQSYEQLLKYLATFDNADAAGLKTSKEHAIKAVKKAISIPEVLNFEDLAKLEAIKALKTEKIFTLVNIFLSDNLAAYQDFVKKNPDFCKKEGLNHEDNLHKIRLLSLASLAASHVENEVAYSTIAKALAIEDDEVEFWVIDVIRAGLVDAKMNQLKKTVVVSRSTHRVFGKEQWKFLGERLNGWRANLKEVLQVIANAKLIAEAQTLEAEPTVITNA
ncbi:uncharacterized protein BJ171DRAFT_520797 [Polychytrium aggregatum]|uniref:uncharacterized protein n=1 Tax=Polychytrium aggregatum TaxID=110093 RepID=UPI0022FDF75B|nr:uncharacterized protein BJ171DRAFT_520797 [Polychytrium aggregatum]KAI9197321.1 hypothetical protein BJ171DRAFT_520797 [Polychytrium aggregatum]